MQIIHEYAKYKMEMEYKKYRIFHFNYFCKYLEKYRKYRKIFQTKIIEYKVAQIMLTFVEF